MKKRSVDTGAFFLFPKVLALTTKSSANGYLKLHERNKQAIAKSLFCLESGFTVLTNFIFQFGILNYFVSNILYFVQQLYLPNF